MLPTESTALTHQVELKKKDGTIGFINSGEKGRHEVTKQRRPRIDVAAGSELTFSQRFLDTMSEHLTKKGEDLLGLDLSEFCVACLPEVTVEIDHRGELTEVKQAAPVFDKDNVAYLTADIVGPDNMGHPALVSWRCTAHPDEQIRPDNPLVPSDGHALEVSWEYLPIEEMRARYLEPPLPYTIDVGDVSFEIQWTPWWKPPVENLNFELITQREVEPRYLEEIELTLWDKVISYQIAEEVRHRMEEQWNLSEDEIHKLAKRGFTNYWTGIVHQEGPVYEIGVDFIIMDDNVVTQWIQALDKVASKLGLIRVKVRS